MGASHVLKLAISSWVAVSQLVGGARCPFNPRTLQRSRNEVQTPRSPWREQQFEKVAGRRTNSVRGMGMLYPSEAIVSDPTERVDLAPCSFAA
ncbi:hypothetical protein Q31a_31550 [Aureliella helgolandensis]|uniref:Uncharacterized protein n=1 Tax=Aureliella helgolandensis TaxID=2527968 RepID=A0A518G8C7_9BACT|nr:hypothetical protein Q31a_31550 [Aureliella helgolandensis]